MADYSGNPTMPLDQIDYNNRETFYTMLLEIFTEYEELEYLRGSLLFIDITPSSNVRRSALLGMKKDELDPNIIQLYDTYDAGSSKYLFHTIVFSEILPQLIDVHCNNCCTENTSVLSKQILNFMCVSQSQKSINFNINSDLKIKGYMYNLKNCMTYTAGNRYSSIIRYFYVGDRNIFIGAFTKHGQLYIRTSVIDKLLNNPENNYEDVKKCLLTLFMANTELFKAFEDLNITKINQHITRELDGRYRQRFIEKITRKYPDATEDDIDWILSGHKNLVFKECEYVLKNTIFGATDQYSYSKLMNDLSSSHTRDLQRSAGDAFREGMKFGQIMQIYGWENYPDGFISDPREVWWFKDVNIIPEIFIYNDEYYEIPNQLRRFHIDRLYISSHGHLRCEGDHPNTKDGIVCIGNDLKILFNNIKDIEEKLKRVDILLEVINFDSAYGTVGKFELIESSKKIYNVKIKTNPTIREIGKQSDEFIELPQVCMRTEDGPVIISESIIDESINTISSSNTTNLEGIQRNNFVFNISDADIVPVSIDS